MKVLSPPAQGALAFLLIAFLAMAPTALNLSGPYALACYLLAGAYLVLTLLTDFPMGVVRLLSYRTYGRLEIINSLAFMGAPFLFGFAASNPTARTFFMGFGAALLVLWVLTDWSGKVHSEMADRPGKNLEGRSDDL
ncbi:hypothetical protein A0257_11340 [Hymenobacter psoromatis]|nr:hypothetical protein A0257_11340 [Hymenobacter psoromatis]